MGVAFVGGGWRDVVEGMGLGMGGAGRAYSRWSAEGAAVGADVGAGVGSAEGATARNVFGAVAEGEDAGCGGTAELATSAGRRGMRYVKRILAVLEPVRAVRKRGSSGRCLESDLPWARSRETALAAVSYGLRSGELNAVKAVRLRVGLALPESGSVGSARCGLMMGAGSSGLDQITQRLAK